MGEGSWIIESETHEIFHEGVFPPYLAPSVWLHIQLQVKTLVEWWVLDKVLGGRWWLLNSHWWPTFLNLNIYFHPSGRHLGILILFININTDFFLYHTPAKIIFFRVCNRRKWLKSTKRLATWESWRIELRPSFLWSWLASWPPTTASFRELRQIWWVSLISAGIWMFTDPIVFFTGPSTELLHSRLSCVENMRQLWHFTFP